MKQIALALFLAALAFPAQAENHLSEGAEMGAAAFRLCQACHVIVDDEGNTIAGRKAKTGPNLYGIIGRTAGTVEGFRYGRSLVAAGEAGLVWDEEHIVQYLLDTRKFLQSYLDDNSARSKMSFKVRPDRKNDLTAEEVARNFYLFLQTAGPAAETGTDLKASETEDPNTGQPASDQQQNQDG